MGEVTINLDLEDHAFLVVKDLNQANIIKLILDQYSTIHHMVYKFDLEPPTDWESLILDKDPRVVYNEPC